MCLTAGPPHCTGRQPLLVSLSPLQSSYSVRNTAPARSQLLEPVPSPLSARLGHQLVMTLEIIYVTRHGVCSRPSFPFFLLRPTLQTPSIALVWMYACDNILACTHMPTLCCISACFCRPLSPCVPWLAERRDCVSVYASAFHRAFNPPCCTTSVKQDLLIMTPRIGCGFSFSMPCLLDLP